MVAQGNVMMWKEFTFKDDMAFTISECAESIARREVPPFHYVWVSGTLGDSARSVRVVGFGERPDPREFEESDWLVHIDRSEAARGPRHIRKIAHRLADRAVFLWRPNGRHVVHRRYDSGEGEFDG